MKRYLFVILLLMLSLPASSEHRSDPPAALLMVHFGTSYDETREQTIDAINELARSTFPDMEVREAWTSRMIVKKLKGRGIEKPLPVEALMRLRADGFTRVLVQPTTLLEGVEMAFLRSDVASLAPFFDEIRIGEPLLSSVDDCRKVAEILMQRHGNKADAKKHAHVVFVGHGTYAPANATYSQMEHILQHTGGPLFHVATIEGYPALETLLDDLKASKARKVTLVPMLLVAGDHATNDIAGEWKEALEVAGMEVEVILEGLGQIPEIQDRYMDHARSATGRTSGQDRSDRRSVWPADTCLSICHTLYSCIRFSRFFTS